MNIIWGKSGDCFRRLGLVNILSVALVLLLTNPALANPTVFDAWQQQYPNYNVAAKSCQICHQTNPGQDGWNAYGFDVRFFVLSFGYEALQSAFETVEGLNSDNDLAGLSNIDEIDLGLDPGWAPGPINTIFFKDGVELVNQRPPFPENDDEICLPLQTKNDTIIVICL